MHVSLDHASIPPRALWLSVAALAVPVAGAFSMHETAADYELLLWLLALVPAFLLAYYRGWRGVATALASGMAVLSLTQAALAYAGESPENWSLLLIVVAIYITVALGLGWVSEMLHRARRHAESLAMTDELTRLPNRRRASLFLATEFAAAERGRALIVVLFDLDHFKRYNDRFGHLAGDEALRAFGGVLATHTRRMNVSARHGGEEFISILSESTVEGATVFVERVRAAFRALDLPGAPLTASAGMAVFSPSMSRAEDLVAAADRALYRAKAEGRDRCCVADEERGAVAAVAPAIEPWWRPDA